MPKQGGRLTQGYVFAGDSVPCDDEEWEKPIFIYIYIYMCFFLFPCVFMLYIVITYYYLLLLLSMCGCCGAVRPRDCGAVRRGPLREGPAHGAGPGPGPTPEL